MNSYSAIFAAHRIENRSLKIPSIEYAALVKIDTIECCLNNKWNEKKTTVHVHWSNENESGSKPFPLMHHNNAQMHASKIK